MTIIQSREVKVIVDLGRSGGWMRVFSECRCGEQNATAAPNSVRKCLPSALPRGHHRPWPRLSTGESLASKGRQARRSEERRVGKECSTRRWGDGYEEAR